MGGREGERQGGREGGRERRRAVKGVKGDRELLGVKRGGKAGGEMEQEGRGA